VAGPQCILVARLPGRALRSLALRATRIDFSGKRPAPPAWVLVLLVLGIAAGTSAVWRVSETAMRAGRAAADVERARKVLAARLPPEPARAALPETRVVAINNAITQLNLPWAPLFESLENLQPRDVALLSLEPDGKKRLLRILAEAKQPDDMIAFVRLLREQPQFADAVLLKHEVNVQDPNRPIRFLVQAWWKASL